MVKKTINYTDYNGIKRTEDFYFNLTEAELAEWEFSRTGGLSSIADKMVKTDNRPEIMKLYKEIITKSYGEKTADGRGFKKSEEILENFLACPAYSQLFMELARDEKAMADFINNVIPSSLAEKAKELEKKNNVANFAAPTEQ